MGIIYKASKAVRYGKKINSYQEEFTQMFFSFNLVIVLCVD